MTTAHDAHAPIPRQLWIKDRCLALETQFRQRTGRAAFAVRILPLLAILVLVYLNGLRTSPVLPGWIATPVAMAVFYFALLALSHRFHDLGQSGANLLQIVLPVFIWLWVGGDLMDKLPARIWIATAVVLAAWPAFVLLRLLIQRSGAAPGRS